MNGADTDPDPGEDAFEAMAARSLARLPTPFRRMIGELVIRIDDFADRETLDHLGIDDPYGLLGLYHGIDVTEKSGFDTVPGQDMVFLYRQPILAFWRDGDDTLEEIVEHVLVHEIGHHFGLSDDDMHGLEDAARAEEGGSRPRR